jgi:hypothetical protein
MHELNQCTILLCAPDCQLPCTHEGMLHEWKLIWTVACIVDDTVHEPLLKREGSEPRLFDSTGSYDCVLHLHAIKPWHKELTTANGLWQTKKGLAIPNKV